METTSYFSNSHGFVIESGGNLATVHGNQILNYFNHEPARKTALTIYDQFRQVIQGDINRTKDIGVYKYSRQWDVRDRWWGETGKLRADRTICTAQVIGGEGRVFTVITYSGPEAQEAFEKDFQIYARTLNAGPFQVFGVNTNVPTVLFYGERQPLANFLGGLGYWEQCYLQSLRKQFRCDDNEIWLDPKKGELCRGPVGPNCRIPCSSLGDLELEVLPCSADLLQDGSCLRFLASCKSKVVDRWVTQWIAEECCLRGVSELEVYQPTVLSTLTDTTIAVNGQQWRVSWGCLGEREVMEKGALRFTLAEGEGDCNLTTVRTNFELEGWMSQTSSVFYHAEGEGDFKLTTVRANELEVWMSQASSVFHQRGNSLIEDRRQYELIVPPDMYLYGRLSDSEITRQRRSEKPIYLFVCPLSPSDTPMEDWTPSYLNFHYWSFDPTGQHPLPAKMCKDLGLPIELSFDVWSTRGYRYHWCNVYYRMMYQYALAGGFNPKTSDFARHLGYDIYQVQNDSNRFGDLSPDNNDRNGTGFWSKWSWVASEGSDIPVWAI